ncbi:MAG TPA: 23S rRNA (adenine(2503)-C(2))-methyltransferase RlmN [Actinomycetota bacterium]|nr:23S rRNA (adenine(2503)-C(2))-methyltransferase RlmN [Actinomycetota bacterium]
MDALPFDVPGPPYRRRQVRQWVFKRFAGTFSEMHTLPAPLREELTARHGRVRPDPVTEQVSDSGGTVKALFPDGYETVAMRYPGRLTVCVSSQAGCGLGCTFCATGQMGLIRNLAPFEIVQQALWAGERMGARPSNVVFMGMGEPLANYDPVLAAVRSLHDDVGISARRITVSTVGLVPQMRNLAHEDLPVRLALSLHAPDDETRSSLVPVNRRWPVSECLQAAREFRDAHGRRVSIEYALIADVNDRTWQAEQLASLLKGTDLHVNLIPLNPTPGYGVPGSTRVEAFAEELKAGGVNVTVRDTRGRDIDAACGQLATARSGSAGDITRRPRTGQEVATKGR